METLLDLKENLMRNSQLLTNKISDPFSMKMSNFARLHFYVFPKTFLSRPIFCTEKEICEMANKLSDKSHPLYQIVHTSCISMFFRNEQLFRLLPLQRSRGAQSLSEIFLNPTGTYARLKKNYPDKCNLSLYRSNLLFPNSQKKSAPPFPFYHSFLTRNSTLLSLTQL